MTSTTPDDGRNARTLGALFGLLIIAGFLLGLIAMILPQALGLVIVFGGFLGLFSLHYLLWGCWLSKLLVDDSRGDESPSPPQER